MLHCLESHRTLPFIPEGLNMVPVMILFLWLNPCVARRRYTPLQAQNVPFLADNTRRAGPVGVVWD